MLVLSRKKNESIVINDDFILTIVEIRSDRVKIGIRDRRLEQASQEKLGSGRLEKNVAQNSSSPIEGLSEYKKNPFYNMLSYTYRGLIKLYESLK